MRRAPIHEACEAGDAEAVRRELAAGVSPDLREANVSPLLLAVDLNRMEIMLLLIEAGADVNLAETSYSPLHIACEHGCKARVAALLAAGASASLLRETPMMKTRPVEIMRSGQKHVLPMLLRAGCPLPRLGRATWMQPGRRIYNAAATAYVNAVAAAGGYVPYARAHRKRLAAIFTPKFPQLPEEVVPTIVEFWAHVGHY